MMFFLTVQHPMLTMVILSLDSAKVSVLVQKHPKTSVLGAPRNNLIEGALGGGPDLSESKNYGSQDTAGFPASSCGNHLLPECKAH